METIEAVVRLALIGLMLLLLVGGFISIVMLWYFRRRDPHSGLVADISAEPPDDLPPGAVDTLLDGDHSGVQDRLLFKHKVEVPLTGHDDHRFVRVSVQGYTAGDELL